MNVASGQTGHRMNVVHDITRRPHLYTTQDADGAIHAYPALILLHLLEARGCVPNLGGSRESQRTSRRGGTKLRYEVT